MAEFVIVLYHIRTAQALLVTVLVLAFGPVSLSQEAALSLPTPREHYQAFDVDAHARRLTGEVLAANPQLRPLLPGLPGLLAQAGNSSGSSVPGLTSLLTQLSWTHWEQDILEQLIHRSRVLEIMGPELQHWRPFVHDSLILFFHELGPDEVLERFVGQRQMSADAGRGDRVLTFATGAPVLQKIAQIIARNPLIPEDFRLSLQQFENSIVSTDAGTLVRFIETDLGEDTIRDYQLQLESKVLAEASVGAIVAGNLKLPGEQDTRRIVCKVIKPAAEKAMREELRAFEALGEYLETNGEFYELGNFPLSDLFNEIRNALGKEILVVEEQRNLARAAEYYAENPLIVVPAIYELSTPNVTVMDFIKGVKITASFPGDPEARSVMAHRLSNALTYDVIFNRRDQAIFHGDPHAGNVYHFTGGNGDRYRSSCQ